jgi:VWFA-related protein
MRARLICGGVVALSFLGPVQSPVVSGQSSQTGSSQGTFRATTNLVEVDVIIHDGDGRFVPGLTAEDLTLFEDGKRQTIQQFYMVSHDAAGPGGIAAGSAPVPQDRARRVFVVMFDEAHLSNDSLMRVKNGAELFLQNQFGQGDLGGIFADNQMFRGKLTTSKAELVAGIQSVKPAFENRQALLQPFREFPRIPSEIDAARIADGARELVERIGQDACRQDAFLCEQNGGLNQVENLIQNKSRLYTRQARVMTGRTLQNLQNVIGSLRAIPGRKTVVLLSEGFFVEESRGALQTLAGHAARIGTAIYAIDGRGLINGSSALPDVDRPEMSRSTTFDNAEDGPTILTSGTGGFRVHHIDDISRAFNMIARDTGTYYVIGYQPTNGNMDGKYRKIEVKTKAPGVNIRARKGYVATPWAPAQQIGR